MWEVNTGARVHMVRVCTNTSHTNWCAPFVCCTHRLSQGFQQLGEAAGSGHITACDSLVKLDVYHLLQLSLGVQQHLNEEW